mgnify:CR=1 FL=1
MEIAKASIVRSDAGRDKGKLFVVLAVEGEYLLLADGKGRKVESPKRKKRRHVLFVAADDSRLSDKIKSEVKITNSELRRTSRPTAGRFIRTRRDNVWQNPT